MQGTGAVTSRRRILPSHLAIDHDIDAACSFEHNLDWLLRLTLDFLTKRMFMLVPLVHFV
jgi:hypothetical protein